MPYTKFNKQTNPMNLKALALATIATLSPVAANANTLQQEVAADPLGMMQTCVQGFYVGMKTDPAGVATLRRAGVPLEEVASEGCGVMVGSLAVGNSYPHSLDLMKAHIESMVKPYFSHSYDGPLKTSDLYTLIR